MLFFFRAGRSKEALNWYLHFGDGIWDVDLEVMTIICPI